MTQDQPRPLNTERAAQSVARHIEQLILEGSLRPGEALLPERELAQRLDISRPTLREGLKILESQGLLASEHGRGMRIADLGAASIGDPLIALLARHSAVTEDYLEFRDIVERSAAGLAARRASDMDIARITACLARIDQAHDSADPGDEADADAELHQIIYEASHNLVLLQIMRALSGNLRSDVLQNRSRMFAIPAIRDLLRQQHRAIAQAIIARDPVAAERAAHEHLAYIQTASRELRQADTKRDLARRRLNGGGLSQRAQTAE